VKRRRLGLSTRAIHGDPKARADWTAVAPPLYQSSTFTNPVGSNAEVLYSRYGNNPNQVDIGKRLALLEGADGLSELDQAVRDLLDRAELTQALEAIWVRVRRLNRYVEEQRPWDLAKEAQAERLDQVLYNLAEGIRVLALLLFAYMPEASSRLLDALGEGHRELAGFGSRSGGQRVGELGPLFPKVE